MVLSILVFTLVSYLDKWTPYEIAVFEAAISVFGKKFHKIAKLVYRYYILLIIDSHKINK